MADSCVYIPTIKLSSGVEVESKLFRELLSYTENDRKLTKSLYSLSKDSRFIELNNFNSEANQNEYGEPAFSEFIRITGISQEDKIIDFLNKDLKAGSYSYDDAVDKVTKYNASKSEYKRGYIATLSYNEESGKYDVYITKDTYQAQKNLVKQIKKETLRKRFEYYLKRLGVTYSTESNWNESVIDDFYNLVKISMGNNMGEFEENLAFGAASFAVVSMANNPLVQNLFLALTPEARYDILQNSNYQYQPRTQEIYTIKDDKWNEQYHNIGTREEAAAFLIAQSFLKNEDRNTYIKNKVIRAKEKILNFFNRVGTLIKKEKYTKARLYRETGALVRQIVEDFTNVSPTANPEPIIEVPSLSLSTATSTEAVAYTSILQQISVSVEKLNAISPGLAEDLQAFKAKYYEIDTSSEDYQKLQNDSLKRMLELSRVGEAIYKMSETLQFTVIPNLEKTDIVIDLDNPQPWLDAYRKNGLLLRSAREQLELTNIIYKQAEELLKTLESKNENPNDPIEIFIRQQIGKKRSLQSLLLQLHDSLTGIETDLINKERNFFGSFLAFIEGGTQIQHSARILFKTDATTEIIGKTLGRKNKDIKRGIYAVIGSSDNIFEALESIHDTSLFSRWIASMSNNEDITGVLLDKISKQCNKQAEDKCYEDSSKIISLREEGVKLGLSHDLHELIEYEYIKDDKDKIRQIPTGNFIQERNYGKWEDDWEEVKQSIKATKQFRDIVETEKNMNHISRGEALYKIMKDVWKAWNKEHSILIEDEFGSRYVPNESYHNPDWDKLTPEQQAYSKKWIEFKASKEVNINGAKSHRLPQISGATVATLSQHIKREGLLKGVSSAVFPRIRTALTKRLDPQEFGTDITYNRPEDDAFGTSFKFELEKIHRLPVYGVNKYNKKDRVEKLSTNIVNTMLSYCVMANTYNAFSSVIDALEIGRGVLIERDKKIDQLRGSHKVSNAYYRFDKFMDKQIYNLNTTIINKASAVNGILNGLNSLAAIVYLGGNIPGGAVNLGTGLIQLYSEAKVGEFMSIESLRRAGGIYMASLVPMMMEDLGGKAGIGTGLNKMSLFIDKMNALGDARTRLSSYEEGFAGWAQRVLSPTEIAMLPYSVGEKLMQGVTYAAVAMDTPVVNLDTNETSNVWDMYDTFVKGKGINKYTLGKKGGTWVVPSDKYGITTINKYYNTLKDLKEYLVELKNDPTSGSTLDAGNPLFTEALNLLHIDPASDLTKESIIKAINRINLFFDDVEWNSDKESSMMDKAREINNRLHGIYNKQDKTALSNNVVGATLLVMKNYALGYIQSKFAPDHYSEVFGKDVEGSLNTLAKVLGLSGITSLNTLRDWVGLPDLGVSNIQMSFKDTCKAILLPYSQSTQKMLSYKGFSENQISNMKRNLNDLIKIAILDFIKFITYIPSSADKKKLKELHRKKDKSLFDKYKIYSANIRDSIQDKLDDVLPMDDYERLYGIIYYMSMRLSFEQKAYAMPTTMFTEWKSLLNLTPVAFSALYDFGELTEYAITGEEYSKDSPTYHYKAHEKKWYVKLRKMTPYWKFLYWWEHPYEAAKSYEYGVLLRSNAK